MNKEESTSLEKEPALRESDTRVKIAPCGRRGATPSVLAEEPVRRSARARGRSGDEAA